MGKQSGNTQWKSMLFILETTNQSVFNGFGETICLVVIKAEWKTHKTKVTMKHAEQ